MASGLLSLKWNHHRSTFLHVLANIRQKESYCDVTLACAGKFYSAHKLVLSTCSEYFEEMFERTQCKHPVIVLKDIGADELEALLSYMYDGEVNVLQEHLSSLIKAAECLKIKGLAVADSDPSEHSSNSTKDKNSSSSSNSKDVHRSHNSTNSSNHNSFPSDSSSRQFRNSSGGVKRPNLGSKQDDGPSKRRRPESSASLSASPARRQSLERPGSAQRGVASDGKTVGDDGASDVGDGGGEDGNNSMEGPPPAADDQPPEDGGQDDAQSFAQGLSEQTGVKAEPVEIIDSDDMGGFDPQGGDGGSHDASDAEFTEEKFEGGPAADANDPSMWGAGATNDMFSQPSTSSFTGQDGSNSNDNSGGKGGGSSMTADQYLRYLESNTSNNNMSSAGAPPDQLLDVRHQAHRHHYLERYLKKHHSQQHLSVALLHPLPSPLPSPYTENVQMIKVPQHRHQLQQLSESTGPSPTDVAVSEHKREAVSGLLGLEVNSGVPSSAESLEPPSGVSPRRSIPRIAIDRDTQAALLESFVDGQRTKCPYCNFACVRKDNFKIHLRRHTGEKPYVCSFCLKGFASKPEMSIHEKTHTGEKDYLCPHCDYRGKRKYNLQMHLLNRHRDPVFPQ